MIPRGLREERIMQVLAGHILIGIHFHHLRIWPRSLLAHMLVAKMMKIDEYCRGR